MTDFSLLGSLQVRDGEQLMPICPPKVRQVLAILLLRANQVVPVDLFIEELWRHNPPRSATPTLQTYVYQLRKTLQGHAARPDATMIRTQLTGYSLLVDPGRIDVMRFRQLVDSAAALHGSGEHEEALEGIRQALALWRGPELADVPHGPVLDAYAAQLAEERLHADEVQVKIAFALGQHRQQIAGLRQLVALYPLHEWFHGRLIEALARSGRRSEALAAYQRLRRVLSQELGLSPSAQAQRLQQAALSGSPG